MLLLLPASNVKHSSTLLFYVCEEAQGNLSDRHKLEKLISLLCNFSWYVENIFQVFLLYSFGVVLYSLISCLCQSHKLVHMQCIFFRGCRFSEFFNKMLLLLTLNVEYPASTFFFSFIKTVPGNLSDRHKLQ